MEMNMKRPNKRIFRRRGAAAVLAMMFLVIFSTLAEGFYASSTTAVQVSSNELHGSRSMLAAQSGMEFMRYHLASLDLPYDTTVSQVLPEAYARLSAALENTPNLGNKQIGFTAAGELAIPLQPDEYIPLDSDGSRFRAVLSMNGSLLNVKIQGRYGNTSSDRVISMDFERAQDASAIFDYGVASKSAIYMKGNVSISGTPGKDEYGSVLSTTLSTPTPLTMIGSAKISGDVSITNPDESSVSIGSQSTVAGFKPSNAGFWDHVHSGVTPPEFPIVDTRIFLPYVPPANAAGPSVITSSNPSGTHFKNIRIKANANPTFNANTLLQGVVYIETPNRVSFAGSATIQGVVVVQTDGNNNQSLNTELNLIDFGGTVNAKGIETLPDTEDFPPSLRALKGAMLLAPGFKAKFRGNFGTVSGSIIASELEFVGTAGGTVKGSVINLKDTMLTLSGNSDIVIESQGTGQYPAGVYFGDHYRPLPATYLELAE
jgi:hypothetical protein